MTHAPMASALASSCSHTLMRGVDVVGERAADAGNLVGRHHGALAGSADEHRAVGFTSKHGKRMCRG
jgi:hypothetical protein